MPKYCVYCGKMNQNPRFSYCSEECRSHSPKHCIICGKPIEPIRKTCSRKCAGQLGLNKQGPAPRNVRKRDENGNYWCNGCHRFLPELCFDKLCAGRLRELPNRTNLQSRCKECQKNQRIKWHSNIHSHLLGLVKKAGKRNKNFNLPSEWAIEQFKKQDGKCYYTGISMTTKQGKGKIWSNASIDRIDNGIGYIPSNCVLCCNGFNLMKNTLPIGALIVLCKKFVEKIDNNELEKIKMKNSNIQDILQSDFF